MNNEVTKVDNPYGTSHGPQEGGMALIEQSRAVAEAVAERQIARSNPRDQRRAMDLILTDCTLHAVAEDATYEYARGGSDISGASIRLAELIARRWGNIKCGVAEISRRDEYSEVKAYAIDLETGTTDEKIFQVKHWRDTKKGGYVVKDERDIYEVVANAGARRKRACILAVIPKDVQDAAVRQCELTLKTKMEITPEFIASVIDSFEVIGVNKAMLEARIQRKMEALTPALALQLRRIKTSIRDGMSKPEDWFDGALGPAVPTGEAAGQSKTSATDAAAAALAAKRAPKPPVDRNAAADKETGEITNESVRAAIAAASSQEALQPIMLDMMKLTPGAERDQTSKLWTERVMALKDGTAAKPAPTVREAPTPTPTPTPKPAAKPAGTAKDKGSLLRRMNQAVTQEKLDEVAAEVSLYTWAEEADEKELAARYRQCTEDLAL